MGWVSRPASSSAWSDQSQSSATLCSAKSSGPARLTVASQVTALAPFSQNSNEEVCLGSGQAQPGQSKPLGWFIRKSARVFGLVPISCRTARATAAKAPQPAAGPV